MKVRFLHAQRFAECAANGAVDVSLTSGGWDVNVAASGFESGRLAHFEVREGRSIDLGRVALERGNGVIEGRVRAGSVGGDPPLVVELFGSGDGRGDERNQLQVVGDRAFRFAHLAAGAYRLCAYDPTRPIVARFELRNEDGRRVTGASLDFEMGGPAPIVYEFRRDGRAVATVETPPPHGDTLAPACPSLATRGSAPDAGGGATEPHGLRCDDPSPETRIARIVNAQTRSVGRERRRAFTESRTSTALQHVDRARTSGGGLASDWGEPVRENLVLQVTVLRPDCHEVAPLPRAELTRIVSCGAYRSDEIALDLRNEPASAFVVVLTYRREIAAWLAEVRGQKPEACVRCHGPAIPRGE